MTLVAERRGGADRGEEGGGAGSGAQIENKGVAGNGAQVEEKDGTGSGAWHITGVTLIEELVEPKKAARQSLWSQRSRE